MYSHCTTCYGTSYFNYLRQSVQACFVPFSQEVEGSQLVSQEAMRTHKEAVEEEPLPLLQKFFNLVEMVIINRITYVKTI